ARHTINGWPVWFTRSVGKGKIVFTTLGPRGWYRPRGDRESLPYENYPPLPLPMPALYRLAEEVQPPPEEDPFRTELFRPMLIEEIGHSVLSRVTVGLIFGGWVLATLLLGIVLRKAGWPGGQGWLAPAAAVGLGVGF